MIQNRVLLIIAVLFVFSSAKATLILPPQDLGEMLYSADIVVYGKILGHPAESPYENIFQVAKNIKGSFKQGDEIIVDEYGGRNRDIYTRILGDVDYVVGEEYLLFLFETHNGHYKANMLAMGVWQNIRVDSKSILMHTKEFSDLCIVDNGSNIQSIKGSYEKSALLKHFRAVVEENTTWNYAQAGYTDIQKDDSDINNNEASRLGDCPNNPPAHCTTIIGNPGSLNNSCSSNSPGKFPSACGSSPNFTVYVSSQAADDPSSTTEITDLQNAVAAMNGMPGLNVTYGGLSSCPIGSPSTCPTSTAISCTPFSASDLFVFFDDPCSEVGPLSGCSGTLGFGGSFSSFACHSDCCGDMWRTNGQPFLTLNDGIGCLSQYEYTATLTHEMLHAVGLDHIGGSCTALMNGSICNTNASAPQAPNFGITALDTDCTDWMYKIEVLPISLSNFDAEVVNDYVAIEWVTSSEVNNDFFTIERSIDHEIWTTIAKIKGAGSSYEEEEYATLDRDPLPGTSYYRLGQTDYDGSYTSSEVISVNFKDKHSLKIFPNPANGDIFYISLDTESKFSKSAKMTIYDLRGSAVRTHTFHTYKSTTDYPVSLENIQPGIYLIEINYGSETYTTRLVRN